MKSAKLMLRMFFDALLLSAAPSGQVAFINLLAGGTQDINYVGVSNVHAISIHLAPTLTNDSSSGDSSGWFAQGGGGAPIRPPRFRPCRSPCCYC